MEALIRRLLCEIGEDPDDPRLKDTPQRVATLFAERTHNTARSLDTAVDIRLLPAHSADMVILKHIEFYSLCEHHLLPFFGHCHIAYVPDQYIVGLSTLSQVVDFFSRTLQLQERLTTEIAQAVMHHTQAKGVGVIMEAQQLCLMMRGMQAQGSRLQSSTLLGCIRDNALYRQSFLTRTSDKE